MKATALIAFLCVFAVFSVALKTELRRETSPISTLKIGNAMPDFTLTDVAGKKVKFSEIAHDKKIVMINFWATWCGPCRVEMPSFEKIYNAQKNNGFVILAVTEDENRAKLDEYLKSKPVSFPILIDADHALSKQYKIESLPTTILVGEGGKIRSVHEGVQPYFEYAVETALKQPAKR